MPSEKKKKAKLKKQKAGDKTKVKAEPIDLKPLTTYIDDRVELIRQTFMCLKPKTVKQIAPDFLQGKSIEKIQEYCLDEVLGISKKRLIAIINNTKCPTDTESEDSDDSDVQKVDGHISLEEISSDSDEDGKKKPAKKAPGTAKAATSNAKPAEQNGKGGKNEKEMTVLELLELQARARAIRSQLAQEPVTKIELKSDSDGDEQPQQPSSSAAPEKRKKKTKSTDQTPAETPAAKKPDAPAKTAAIKRVKLKRNFRKREVGDEDSEPEIAPEEKSPEKEKTPPKEPEKVSDRSRDSSPEVIPLVAEPEVLCLSSESEGEAAEALARRKREREKSSIFRADYLESLEQKSMEYIDSLKKKKSAKEPVVEAVVTPAPAKETVKPVEPEDPEEGEIQEEVPIRTEAEEEAPPEKAQEEPQPATEPESTTDKRRSDSSACLSVGLDNEELDYDDKDEEEEQQQPEKPPPSEPKSSKPNSDEEAEDSGSESGSDNSSQSDSEPENKNEEAEEEEKDLDTIEIHDSSDDGMCGAKADDGNDQVETSWSTRWLESSKVKKIIATSKLANKVRGKLKKKKKSKDAAVAEEKAAENSPKPEEAPAAAAPEHELGSVKQYQDILAGEKPVPLEGTESTEGETKE